MKKKAILCALLVSLMLTSCTPAAVNPAETDNPAETCPGHSPASVGWNDKEHWDECACGEKMNTQEHILDDRNICITCGVKIEKNEYDVVFVSSYDEQGNLMTLDRYKEGFLYSESKYGYNANGEHMQNMQAGYYEDGEKFIGEFDELGNCIHEVRYDAAGKITQEFWNEYDQDIDGGFYCCRSHYINYDIGGEAWHEHALDSSGYPYWSKYEHLHEDGTMCREGYNEYGDDIYVENFDAQGNLTSSDKWDYGYDDDGNELWQKEYHDGVLIREVTDYVEWMHDEWNMTIRRPEFEIRYQDGKQLTVYFTYDNDGFIESELIYDGDRLIREEKYDYPESLPDSQFTIIYHEDGTKTVIEYKGGDFISEITYDAEGNVIG